MGRPIKDKRDRYQALARAKGFRNRGAFKLIHLDEQFNLFKDVKTVVDLGAAPGSWSQVLSKELYQKSPDKEAVKIVAVDLLAMDDVEGVIKITGDMTQVTTLTRIVKEFESQKVDLIVSDGAPDHCGMPDMEEFVQQQLITAAFNIATFILKPTGSLVVKVYRSKSESFLYSQLKQFFTLVQAAKPKSSRKTNNEFFFVCQDYHQPEGYVPTMFSPLLNFEKNFYHQLTGINKFTIPFNACGDLSAYDLDDETDTDTEPSASDIPSMDETSI